jgi:hypothetical protein
MVHSIVWQNCNSDEIIQIHLKILIEHYAHIIEKMISSELYVKW